MQKTVIVSVSSRVFYLLLLVLGFNMKFLNMLHKLCKKLITVAEELKKKEVDLAVRAILGSS